MTTTKKSPSAISIDEVLGDDAAPEAGAAMAAGAGTLVAECIDDRHPSLVGRVRVRCRAGADDAATSWVPTLAGLAVRVGDRVLLGQPSNWAESIVIGVIDGYARREATVDREGARVELKTDEMVAICDDAGRRLLELGHRDGTAEVRLLSDDVNLDVKGRFRVSAQAIELAAGQGNVEVEASDDVVVRGEMIHLN